MFYDKKKKVYSEVSDTNKNINSDYFNVFQNEFKNLFCNQSLNNIKNDTEIIESDIIKSSCLDLTNNDIVFINLFSKYIKNK